LPTAFGEHYCGLEEKAAQAKTYPGRIFVGNSMPESEQWRQEFAYAVASGEKFVCVQHGSNYGTARHISWGSGAEFTYHALLTWGWLQQEDYPGNFIPVPAPKLTALRNAHRETEPTLAMVTTKIEIKNHRLFGPRPKHWIEYRQLKVKFINCLAQAPRRGLRYFTYRRGNSDLEDEQYLTKQIGQLDVSHGGLSKAMLKARILLLDHPGTSLNESMVANVPTVCYWNFEAWLLSRQAKPLFAALAEAGVIHDTPEAAAEHVNKHWDNIAQWWQSPDVQNARIAWCDQYARTSKFWWLDWIKVLWKL
jgi:putative transferase (TIGR04331 family)